MKEFLKSTWGIVILCLLGIGALWGVYAIIKKIKKGATDAPKKSTKGSKAPWYKIWVKKAETPAEKQEAKA